MEIWMLSFFLLIFISNEYILLLNASCPGIPTSEYNALEDLYDNTNGQFWIWSAGEVKWSFDNCEDPCINNWGGIECDTNNSTILEISLSGYNLTGLLPTTLGDFSNITTLDLSSNSLRGNFMPAIIPKLQYLYLQKNAFVMPGDGFPLAFGEMKDLIVINLSSNQLAGKGLNGTESIFKNLQALTQFYAEKNYLSGPIPLESLVMAKDCRS